MSSRYFATVRRVTWMPCRCSSAASWSSVNGLRSSSSSISFRLHPLRLRPAPAAGPRSSGPIHALREKESQFWNTPARRMHILVPATCPAYRRRMHANLFRHLFDHHRLQSIHPMLQKLLLSAHDHIASPDDRILPLLDISQQLDRGFMHSFTYSFTSFSVCFSRSLFGSNPGSAAESAYPSSFITTTRIYHHASQTQHRVQSAASLISRCIATSRARIQHRG